MKKSLERAPMREVFRCVLFVLMVSAGWLITEISFAAESEKADEAKTSATEDDASADEATRPTTIMSLRPAAVKARVGARLRLEYDYQKLGIDKDNDFYARLYAHGYDLQKGHIDFYTSMRLHNDLDKPASFSFAEDPYASLDNANGVTEDRILQLYADFHSRDKQRSIRLGRQYVEVADFLQLDGGQILINENKTLGGRIYAGHPVSYYTSVSGDFAGGISLVGKPFAGNRTRMTFARYQDDSVDDADNHYFLDIRQQFTDASRVRAQLSFLNDEYRMARADYFYYADDGSTDISLGAAYWGSFDAATRAYSPLYNTLGEQDPYTYTYARITQRVLDQWYLSPGAAYRMAEQTGVNDYNNRDYEKFDLTLIYEPSRAFNASVAVEYWKVEEGDSFTGVSGDVRYRHGRVWEVSGGASFAEYTYDTFSDISYTVSGGQTTFSESGTIIEESPFVYTYYLRGKWRITRKLMLRLQGDVEDNDAYDDLAYRLRGSVEVKF